MSGDARFVVVVPSRLASTRLPRKPLLVGFAAETADLLANARQKLIGKGLDLIVANDVTEAGAGFGHDTNRVQLLSADGAVEALACLPKSEVAEQIVGRVVTLLKEKGK